MQISRLYGLTLFLLVLYGCGGRSGSLLDGDLPGRETPGPETTTGGPDNPATVEPDAYVPPNVDSSYLRDPDSAIDIVRALADFRIGIRDESGGGFYSYLTQDGSVGLSRTAANNSNWLANNKSFVTQTRDAYTFARAYMLTGEVQYLDHARHAHDFLANHGRDMQNGGWFFVADRQGGAGDCPDCSSFWNPNNFKWSFVQHYVPLGPGAICEATRANDVCGFFDSARNSLEINMWDNTYLGYFDQAAQDFSAPRDKSFASIVDALSTHAITASLLQTSGASPNRVVDLADIVVDRFIASIDDADVAFGFPDTFTTDWQKIPQDTSSQVGHLLKAAWMLARVHWLRGDPRHQFAAGRAIEETLTNGGWDALNGVPYTSSDWQSGEINTAETEYWQIEQAVTAGLANWYINANEPIATEYLKMADRALQFFTDHVIDWTYGGTFMLNAPSGAVINSDKGNSYKAEYHSSELFYYVYLYGKLLLQREPVSLYYQISTASTSQIIQFNPLEIQSLQLVSATLNQQALTTFDAATRTVTLSADQGGELLLEFALE